MAAPPSWQKYAAAPPSWQTLSPALQKGARLSPIPLLARAVRMDRPACEARFGPISFPGRLCLLVFCLTLSSACALMLPACDDEPMQLVHTSLCVFFFIWPLCQLRWLLAFHQLVESCHGSLFWFRLRILSQGLPVVLWMPPHMLHRGPYIPPDTGGASGVLWLPMGALFVGALPAPLLM